MDKEIQQKQDSKIKELFTAYEIIQKWVTELIHRYDENYRMIENVYEK